MTKKLKVFGGLVAYFDGRKTVQWRTVVAAASRAEALKLVGVSINYFRAYWCETANETEVAAALANPGIVMRRNERLGKFEKVPSD